MKNDTKKLREFLNLHRKSFNINGIGIVLGLRTKHLENFVKKSHLWIISEEKEKEVFDFFRKLGFDSFENPELKQDIQAEIASLLQQKEDLQQEVQTILSKIKEIKNELGNLI